MKWLAAFVEGKEKKTNVCTIVEDLVGKIEYLENRISNLEKECDHQNGANNASLRGMNLDIADHERRLTGHSRRIEALEEEVYQEPEGEEDWDRQCTRVETLKWPAPHFRRREEVPEAEEEDENPFQDLEEAIDAAKVRAVLRVMDGEEVKDKTKGSHLTHGRELHEIEVVGRPDKRSKNSDYRSLRKALATKKMLLIFYY